MPIYEYECQKCKAHTEVFQKMSDKPLTKCRACGGRLEKQWSQTGFQFKGSGWYVTDYAGRKAETSETTSETTATNGKADAAGETKTATTETASKESGESKKKDKKTEKTASSSTTNKN